MNGLHFQMEPQNKMRTKTHKTLMALAASCVWSGSLAVASPAEAENDGYEMAVRQAEAGFTIFPGASGSLQPNEKVRMLMPVTRGVTYCFLVGVDKRVRDIDLYVFDEQGNEILVDDRRQRRAGTKFVANYTGTAEVYVLLNSSNYNPKTSKYHGIASWSLLVGTRGGSGQGRYEPVDPNNPKGQSARESTPEEED
jgi:hypothetical protein